MPTLATSVQWGTQTPAIYFDVSYTASRSGANMLYTVNVDFAALTNNYGRYFGYPIYLDLSLDGVAKVTGTTVKNASPGNWSAGQVYYHSPTQTPFSVAKTTGTVSLVLKIYSGEGSSRSQTYTYSLPVSPAASVLTLPSAGFTIGSSGSISITRYDSSFTDTVTYSVGTATGTITTINSGGSTSFNWQPVYSLYSQMGGATSKTGTITVTTQSGSTTVGTNTYTFTLKGYASATLTLPSGGFTVNRAGSISVTQGTTFYSLIEYSVGSASGQIGTTTTSGTSSISWTPPSTLYLQMVGKSSTTGTITVTTKTSSTGTLVNKRTYSFTLNAGSVYNPPTVTLAYQRGNGSGSSFTPAANGTTLKVTATINVYGGQTVTYVLKLDGTQQSSTANLGSGTNVQYITNVSTQSSHALAATVTDTLGKSASFTRTVSTEAVPMNINVDLPGIGFGKLAETAQLLDSTWGIKSASTIMGQYLDISNITANLPQLRYRLSDKNDAIIGNIYTGFPTGGGRFYFREYSADANGNPLSNYEFYRLPIPEQGRTTNAGYDIVTSKSDGQLTLTRTANNYVDATSFGRIYVFRKSNIYFIRGNLQVASMGTVSTLTEIGTISDFSSAYTIDITVPAQDGNGVLLVEISTGGSIKIANTSGKTINAFCRFNVTVPSS